MLMLQAQSPFTLECHTSRYGRRSALSPVRTKQQTTYFVEVNAKGLGIVLRPVHWQLDLVLFGV